MSGYTEGILWSQKQFHLSHSKNKMCIDLALFQFNLQLPKFTCNGMSRSRSFCFTINNYTQETEDKLSKIECKYLCYGKEVGASGTPHLQGLIVFANAHSLRGAISVLRPAHVEIMRGSFKQAKEYCCKDGDITERGTPTKDKDEMARDQRQEWEDIYGMACRGEIENIDPQRRIRYYNTFKTIGKDYQGRATQLDDVCGVWIYGPAGTGKTSAVYSKYPTVFVKDMSKWWDGYQGEEVVLLDDLDPTATTWIARFLKNWGDKFGFVAQTKGGALCIRPKKFIVTSNYELKDMGFKEVDFLAINRRFKLINKTTLESVIDI